MTMAAERELTAEELGRLHGKPPKPECTLHRCVMRATSSPREPYPVTYWKCPVPGCEQRKTTFRR